jgi:ribosomal protein S18 acetylase RimI-like enzyme
MELPSGFRLRPARDEDAEAVARFANEEGMAIVGAPLIDADWLRRRWTSPGVDRDRDVALVETTHGEVCGVVSVVSEPPFTSIFALGIVAPAFHGLGIGAALVPESERRAGRFLPLAPPDAQVVIHAGALADEPRVGELLSSQGYMEVRRFELWRIDFSAAPRSATPVEGITIRTMRPDDAERFFEAHREAFADHWGEGDTPYEEFRHEFFDAADYDPRLWFGGWDGGELAGYVGARDESREDSERGYVSLLGVRRPYRRRGVGEALLLHACAELYARGRKGADLHADADSLTGATRLYSRVGMTAHPRFATWEKELRPARGQ